MDSGAGARDVAADTTYEDASRDSSTDVGDPLVDGSTEDTATADAGDADADGVVLPPGVELIAPTSMTTYVIDDADHVYWSDMIVGSSTIWRVWSYDKSGTSPPSKIVEGFSAFEGLAQRGADLYYVASASLGADIHRVAKTGGTPVTVVKATNGGTSLLISGTNLLWYETGTFKTYAASLDGTGKREISAGAAYGVALGDEVFYKRSGGIWRENFATGASASFYDKAIAIDSLATDGTFIYWYGRIGAASTPELGRAPATTGSPVTTYPITSGWTTIKADAENIYWWQDPGITKQPVSGEPATSFLAGAGQVKLVDATHVYFSRYKTMSGFFRMRK